MIEKDTFPWVNMDDDARNQYWASLALRYAKGLGLRTCGRLLHTYGSAYAALQNLPNWKDAGVSQDKGIHVANGSWREQARIEWENAQDVDAHILMWHDDDFPPRLRELSDAPILLYLKGEVSLLKAPALAVVGARNCTSESLRIASHFAKELSKCGLTIVSGMAYGIDNMAHINALQGIGKSIGILGAGIDIVYPMSNIKTFENMRKNGLLVSEFPPHSHPSPMNFPIRNRIISGLSLGVLVIEASLRSGSLITARQALEQNREVYAIPGTMFSNNASGCQELIRQGARAVFSVDDIIRDLQMQLIPYNISVDANSANSQENNIVKVSNLAKVNLKVTKISPKIPSEIIEKNSDFEKENNNKQSAIKPNDLDCIHKQHSSITKNKRPLPQGIDGRVIEFLTDKKSCHIDKLSLEMNIPIAELNATLIKLEIESWVKRSSGAQYSIIK